MVKNLPANAGDARDGDSIPGSEESSEGGNGNPLQYSCLENPRDRGAWQAAVHEVTELDTTSMQGDLIDNLLKLLAYVLGPLIKLDQEEGTRLGKGVKQSEEEKNLEERIRKRRQRERKKVGKPYIPCGVKVIYDIEKTPEQIFL